MELTDNTGIKFLVAIVGPTAVGKSDLAVWLAGQLGWEIVSADSRQFYRELNAGTAKPTPDQLGLVIHHFVNNLSIHDIYSAGRFEADALDLLNKLYQQSNGAILVGGSGMYVNAVCSGFSQIPEVPQEIRTHYNALMEQKGLGHLVNMLEKKDPETHAKIDLSNPQRVVRALEVMEVSGEKFSAFLDKAPEERPFRAIKIGIEIDRVDLYDRINARVDRMIENGLFSEAEELFPFRDLYALQTVGYTEIFRYLDGEYDKEEAIRLLKRNTRRYAKRQLTWFRRDPEVKWFGPDERSQILQYVQENLP